MKSLHRNGTVIGWGQGYVYHVQYIISLKVLNTAMSALFIEKLIVLDIQYSIEEESDYIGLQEA